MFPRWREQLPDHFADWMAGSLLGQRAMTHSLTLVAEWIHFTLLGIVLPTIKLKVYTFWGL